jgi:hypothetical protein
LVVTLFCPACFPTRPRFKIKIGLVSLLNLTDKIKKAVWCFQCVGRLIPRRFMRKVVRGRDAMLTIVKETVGNYMLPRPSFGLYSADLVVINSSLEVIARGRRIIRVRRHA